MAAALVIGWAAAPKKFRKMRAFLEWAVARGDDVVVYDMDALVVRSLAGYCADVDGEVGMAAEAERRPGGGCGRRVDVMLHKVTEYLLKEDDAAMRWLRAVTDADGVGVWVDHPDAVRAVMDRVSVSRHLVGLGVAVAGASSGDYVVLPAGRAGQPGPGGWVGELAARGMGYPVLLKPARSCGVSSSHVLALVFSPAGLDRYARDGPAQDYLAQAYVRHNGVVAKVYCLGDTAEVCYRASVGAVPPDVVADPAYLEFDSQKDLPYAAAGHGVTVPRPADMTISDAVVDAVRAHVAATFRLSLFGFDLVQAPDGTAVLVDVNYFPSFEGFDRFYPRLRAHLAGAASSAGAGSAGGAGLPAVESRQSRDGPVIV